MPKVKTTYPEPDRQKGQRSVDLPDVYINRIIPAYSQPQWQESDFWRRAVANQPFAAICRDTLIDKILALEWKIEPRNSEQRDDLKEEIEYYTKFFEDTGDYEYSEIIEWVGKDCLDIPFGGAVEVGRENDDPEGHVVWIELLDGGTLFPTQNSQYPVGQALKEIPAYTVYFPWYAINRMYSSPRTDIKRKGWGMPPPERIYLSLVSLSRGDVYYANLLLDTPEVGILDLGDMSEDSAKKWIQSWKGLLDGVDPFKIPVLYEHEKPATWIQFNRSPTEMLFDRTIMKYAGICAAGYGMTLSDLGFSPSSNGGETLAGGIRQERNTRKTGLAVLKKKYTAFFNRMLPKELKFGFVDLDDELSVAMGRARLANATAWQILIDRGVFIPNEARAQTIADGLVTISMPEKVDGGDQVRQQQPMGAFGNTQERPGLLGRPVSPSQGGYGEVKSEVYSDLAEFDAGEITQEQDGSIVENSDIELAKAFVLVAKALLGNRNQKINVIVPKQDPPQVTVNVPKQDPPSIIVSNPTPVVNMAEPLPQIVINVPEQKPPVVNVRTPRKTREVQKVKRDNEGNIESTETKTEYAE